MRAATRYAFVVVTALLTTILGACDFIARYTGSSKEDQLVQEALARWTAPGAPFLEGASGRDTVASVSPTGARSWEVAVVPPSGGTPVVWALEVTRTEVYPTFPGDSFARWLGNQARSLGMSTFLPADITGALQRGQIEAVGDLQVRYGAADRSGRNTLERVAYFGPDDQSAESAWRIQPESRSSAVLLRALKTVWDDMARADDRVLTCMGSADPSSVARSIQLECVAKVLDEEFGEGS